MPSRFAAFLNKPTDVASLAVFRIAFGLVLIAQTLIWLDDVGFWRTAVGAEIHFKYYGFTWVPGITEDGMHALLPAMIVLGGMITIGLCYRAAVLAHGLCFTYIFLIDQALYQNHYYLTVLLHGLMLLAPAHRSLSVDMLIGLTRPSRLVPAWPLLLLRFQMGAVYVYGGLAKINGDWLRGQPMRLWLRERDGLAVVELLAETEWGVWLFVWGGLLFDLLIVPLLLWRKTRWLAFIIALGFHVTNKHMFGIGVFPWLAIALTTLYFDPSWPRRLRLMPRLNGSDTPLQQPITWLSRAACVLIGVYCGLQLLVPFRHLLYPGTALWSEQGHRFSWRMKLRNKTGGAEFTVRSPSTNESWLVDPYDRYASLTGRHLELIATRPDATLQLAHFIGREWAALGHEAVTVHANVQCCLNGRPAEHLVDPAVDLLTQPRDLRHAPWICRLTEPLVAD